MGRWDEGASRLLTLVQLKLNQSKKKKKKGQSSKTWLGLRQIQPVVVPDYPMVSSNLLISHHFKMLGNVFGYIFVLTESLCTWQNFHNQYSMVIFFSMPKKMMCGNESCTLLMMCLCFVKVMGCTTYFYALNASYLVIFFL